MKKKKTSNWLFGSHAVRAAWENPKRICKRLIVSPNMQKTVQSWDHPSTKRPQAEIMPPIKIDQLLPKGAVHQGVALEAESLPNVNFDTWLGTEEPGLVVILDQVTDPHNVGAVMRSACAFGASGIIAQDRHAPAITGTLAKSACGAADHIDMIRAVNLARAIESLQAEGYHCIALDERGEHTLAQISYPEKTAIVLGAEGSGVRRLVAEKCDQIARLPTQGPILSLNISNAAAIALYEWARGR